MKEIWKQIIYKNQETKYDVSNLGRVRHHYNMNIKKPHKRKDGYFYCQLHINHKIKKINVHRLVAEAFIKGKTKTRNEVNHINGDKSDNTSSNLEWVTRKENVVHAFKHNLIHPNKEFKNPNNIYNRNMVEKFVKSIKDGYSIKQSCKISGIGLDTGYLIIHGKRYKKILVENNLKPFPTQIRIDFEKYRNEIISLIKQGKSNKEIRTQIPIQGAKDSNYNYYIRKLRKINHQ